MYEKGFAYLLQGEHEKVIYGVLKHLHVSRQDPDYEDLVVEGQLVFAQAFCMYCESHAIVKEAEVMPYLYQKIKWRLLDLLRKQTRTKQRECGLPENASELWSMVPLSFENILTAELVLKLWNTCTPNEQRFLALRLETELSLTEIAKILAVSRKTVYKYRWSILHKLTILK